MVTRPDFVIVGAMRCGTTTLCRQLEGTGVVAVARPKELHYFDRDYQRGPTWYGRHFEQRHLETGAGVVGEATPNYLYHPEALARLAADVPDVKIVVITRDPAERAWSHYWHNVARGKEPLGFAAALAAEPARLAAGGLDRDHYSYVDRGRYRRQSVVVDDLFPGERVHRIELKEHRQDTEGSLLDLLHFLGAPPPTAPVLQAAAAARSNQAVRFRSVTVRNASRSLPSVLKKAVGRLNTVAADNPPMSPAAAALVRDRLAEPGVVGSRR